MDRWGNARYVIEPANFRHLNELAASLRELDRDEILAVGVSVKRAIWRGFRNSILCRAAIIDGEVAAVWGLCVALGDGISPLSDVGVPWLHTSAAAEAMPRLFVLHAKAEVAAMRAIRPRLASYVAANYVQAVRFIAMLGFTVEQAQPVGVNRTMFRRFHIGFDG